MTNSSGVRGIVATTYTLPTTASVITITASVSGGSSVFFTETALAGTPTKLIIFSGNVQSEQAGSILPKQLEAKVEDAHSNAVPGVTITFVDQKGLGTLNPTSGVSNASGIVAISYQLPTTLGTYKITASAAGKSGTFTETATGDAPASLEVVSGNNQSAAVNTALSQPLVVQINDSEGNPITGVSVVFSAPSGTFTGSPATTNSSGQATVNYTTGTSAGPVTVTAAVDKLNTRISVTVTAGAPASVAITGGNNQAATAGTALPQALSVVVADQYSNPVSGVAVTFSEGGVGGSFSNANPVTTTSTGTASQFYTLPPTGGTVNVSATAAGVTAPAIFSETGQ
jgi:Fe-S cluster assembly iron-binding protein IscA